MGTLLAGPHWMNYSTGGNPGWEGKVDGDREGVGRRGGWGGGVGGAERYK